MTDRPRELPAAPPGLDGWPWPAPADLPPLPPAGEWPLITVVTPSYNQARFIEATIRSVLLQGYPHLEYLVIDGGSRDGTTEVLRRYAPWLDFWVSEADRGQAHAINKGLARARGGILCWLNSDDLLEPGALVRVATALRGEAAWVIGACREVDERGTPTDVYHPAPAPTAEAWVRRLMAGQTYSVPQPSTFWTREAWGLAGPLDESMHYAFDHAFFLRLLGEAGAPALIPEPLARFRVHDASKTSLHGPLFRAEAARAAGAHLRYLPRRGRHRFRLLAAHRQGRFLLQQAVAAARSSRVEGLRWLARALGRAPQLVAYPSTWRAAAALMTGHGA